MLIIMSYIGSFAFFLLTVYIGEVIDSNFPDEDLSVISMVVIWTLPMVLGGMFLGYVLGGEKVDKIPKGIFPSLEL